MMPNRPDRALGNLWRFVTEQYFQTLMILFAAIVMVYFTIGSRVPPVIAMVMPWVLLILATSTDRRRWFWMLLLSSIMLCVHVGLKFYALPNHAFVIAYISVALMIAVSAENGEEVMRKLAAWMLSFLMGLALIQKLASSHYMSGNLMGDILVGGETYKNILSVIYLDWPNIVSDYKGTVNSLSNMSPADGNTLPFVLPAGIAAIAMVLTYASIVTQFMMEIALLLRNRLGLWTHYALLGFVVIIYSSRDENVFLSMNCILGYALTNEETKKARVFYVIWIVYLLSMKLTKLRLGLIS